MSALHPLLYRVFDAFDGAGILWLLVSNEVGGADPDGEVDILIHANATGRADSLLQSLSFVRVTTSQGGAHAYYVGYEQADENWARLHVTTELAFGRDFAFRADVAEACLARRRIVDGIATLAPQDAFWVLLLRGLLDPGAFARMGSVGLRELSRDARTDGAWSSVLAPICPPPWTMAGVVEAASRGDRAALKDLAPQLEDLWTRRDRPRVTSRRVAGRVDRVIKRRLAFLARPGLTVALLGPDGTGKSTVATSIARSFPFPARTVYMGLWQRPARRAQPLVPGMDLLGRLAFAWRRYLVGRYHRARRRLVLFDRYTYDALLGAGDRLTRRESVYLGLLAHSCPAPDLVLVLDVPGDVAYARKGEHDVAHLERDRRRFLALAGRISNLEIVDANRPLETVRSDVVARIWRRYQARWRR